MVREKSMSLPQRIGLVLFLPILLPLVVVAGSAFLLHRLAVLLLVWTLWAANGKDVLFVYSDSPIWHDYMVQEILPLMHDRAIVLNWSARKRWKKWSLAVRAFRSYSGYRSFNPMVVVFRPFRPAKVFRFWNAFKDWKHGRTSAVEGLRSQILFELR
jgi:hypothetical protein